MSRARRQSVLGADRGLISMPHTLLQPLEQPWDAARRLDPYACSSDTIPPPPILKSGGLIDWPIVSPVLANASSAPHPQHEPTSRACRPHSRTSITPIQRHDSSRYPFDFKISSSDQTACCLKHHRVSRSKSSRSGAVAA